MENRIKLEKIKYNDTRRIRKIYAEAFPKCERKPFAIIRAHNKSGAGSLLKITLDGKLCGFFFTYFHNEFAMVDYFAIHKDFRNRGIGEIALGKLAREYRDKKIFLEIEDPSASEIAKRRLGFYERCGLTREGTEVNLFSVDMELLTLGDFKIGFSSYFELYRSMLGDALANCSVKCRNKN